jgi:hypothetical protein
MKLARIFARKTSYNTVTNSNEEQFDEQQNLWNA